jgi:hypothetical protein
VDGDELRRLAARVSALAEQVREVAGRAAGAAEVSWRSTAADAFRARLAREAGAVRRAGEEVETVAHLLIRHARAVDTVAADPLTRTVRALVEGRPGR